jgi:hypothetical protein
MSWDAWATQPKSEEESSVTWGDYGKALGQGAAGVGENLASLSRHYFETGKSENAADLSRAIQGIFGKAGRDIVDSMTPEGRDRLSATITSDKFWEHPVSSSALKLTGMTPMIAAAVIPGGLVADASIAAMTAAATGGALSAGDVVNEIYKKTDETSDADLQKASDYYAGLRSSFDEKEARRQYNETLMGLKPALNFVLGTAVGAVGPAANIVRGLKGGAAHGVARGAAEGAAGELVQEGAANVSTQMAEIEGGLKKEFDPQALVDAALEGGVFGGLMGGAGGTVGRRKGKAKANEVVEEQGDGAEDAAVEAAPVAQVQAPQGAGATVSAPPKPVRKGKVSVEVVQPGAPTTAEAAAITDLQQPKPAAQPVVPEVPSAPVEATQQAAPPVEAVPPDVAAPVSDQAVAPSPPEVGAPAAPVPGVEAAAVPPVDAPVAPVTPEVTAPETVPQSSVPVPEAAPVAEAPRKPRVLQVIKDKAAQEADAKAAKEAFKGLNKRAKEAAAAENSDAAPKGKNWTKKELEERAQSAENAKGIFERHVPENDNIPTTPAARMALQTRLGKMLDEVKTAGVKLPTKVGYEGTSDHVVYLRAAADLHRKMGQKSFTGQRRDKQISDFLIAERAARAGDFSVLRETRKVEGDAAMRRDQGDVEAKGGTAGAEAEKDAVQTMIPKSARGPVRMAEEEREAAPVKKIDPKGEAAKKIAAEALARAQKKAAGDVATTALDRAEKPKPEPKPVEKPKTPEATSARVVDKAAKKTNANPSDAQKEAGNYAKGTVKWNGLNVAIETPKGAVRKGMAKIGGKMREWSVKMQDHYGYIKRTEGADGDQVDVFMGPNPKSEDVYIIHQNDLHTGSFDEHKAMLGYDSLAEAMSAYDRSFSDGQGFVRIRDTERMTVGEFYAWVHSDKPKKAAKAAREADETISSALRTEVADKLGSNGKVEALKTIKARDALKSLNLEHLSGVPKALSQLAQKRFEALVGDTDVHILDKYEMARATGDVRTAFVGDETDGVRGMATMSMADGKSIVLLRADQFKTPEATAHAVLHEIAHAATMRALVEDKALYDRVGRMMKETDEFLKDVPDIRQKLSYALTDEREFIAEAFSNPEVQEVLAGIPLSDQLAQELGMSRRSTAWDAIVDTVRRVIEKITGRIPEGMRMIEGVMRLGPEFEAHLNRVKTRRMLGQDVRVNPHEAFDAGQVSAKLEGDLRKKIEGIIKGEPKQEQDAKPLAMALRTMDQISQAADHFFGRENNPVRRVADLVEMIRVKAAANLKKADPILDELYKLEKKYKGKVWEDFTTLVHDETMANVFADRDLAGNSHLGKDTLDGAWGKAQHADLAKRYAELPEDLKAARRKAMKFFTDQQNAMSLGIIKNRILKVMGINDDALARRIHEGRTVDTDADLVGGEDVLETIKEAKELAKIEGPYFPLMRRGDHVVRATYTVEAPAGATKIADNEFEFSGPKAREKALEFAKKQDTRPTVVSRWVDKNTGEKHFADGTKVTKQDQDAEQRFRVRVQDSHVEFFDSAAEAQVAALELAKSGMHVKGVEERRFEPGDRQADMLSTQMRHMVEGLKKRDGYKDLDAKQKNELIQTLNEASIRFLGSTRIQSRRLPRRYVEGASNDLTRNTLEYAQSSSGYLAKLEHQPDLEEAMKVMRDAVTQDEHKNKSLGRSAIANEVERRVAASSSFEEGGKWSAIGRRLMTVSFLDKLFSPAFNIINSMQPAMVTMPTLAARYGVGKSFDAVSRAYRDISGLGIVKKGLVDTVKKAKDGQAKTSDLFADIKKNLSAKEREMIDYLAERGVVDPDAGMEIAGLIKQRSGILGRVDTGLSYMEGVARQMPQAIEMINRSVTAIATYRLEVGRGASHEKAMRAAQESVNNTQGLYSTTNAAPIFNHPVAKLSLQFKKYGQMMYHLLGSNIGKALRNAEPGDRADAIKTLTGIVATHVAMAGALGLPTEPFKYLLMGAQAAGLTTTGWGDVENKVREQAANYFGKTGGEILTRGLPRAIGIDLSTRVGLDSMSSFGEPKSNKDSDVKSWMFDTLAGAPAALVGDWVRGMNALTSGDFVKAGELMVPMKFASDSIKAYRLATEGKKGATGKETMAPYSPIEAAVRAVGFTPAREAEQSAKNSAFYSASKKEGEERTQLMGKWVSAKPSDKLSAWKSIQSWNKGKPRDAQITMSDLSRAAARRQKEGDKTRTTKRDQYIMNRADSTYNP